MRGCFNPKAKYSRICDVNSVFDFMKCQASNSHLSHELPQNLATLLALTTWMRSVELASINRESIEISSEGVVFSLDSPRKTQSSGALKSISLLRFPDKQICLVDCLGVCILHTNYLKGNHNNSRLFIGLTAPHNPVSGCSVGRWVKSYIRLAGIDTNDFLAHSTRSAAASYA